MHDKIKLKKLQDEAAVALAKGNKPKAKEIRLEILKLLRGK